MFDCLKTIFKSKKNPDLGEMIQNGAFLVDVRSYSEFSQGHPEGSINIPLDVLIENINQFKGKKSIIVFCRSGNRSEQAKNFLEEKGFQNVVNGGTWGNVSQYAGYANVI